MKRKNFKIKKSDFKSWDYVFKNQCPVSVKSFITGYVMINKRGAINPDHPDASDIDDELLKVPVLSHWIHHKKYGDYLVDAGLDSSYSYDPNGEVRGLFSGLFKKFRINIDEYYQEKNQNIGFYLKKYSIKLNGVFLSHLHVDHIAGVRELPKNIPYIVGKGEKYTEHKPFFYGDYLKGIDILYEIDFSYGNNMPILGQCVDIFGDGSFWAIRTPGHTPGHMSFLINGQSSPILLANDACFINLGLEMGVGSSDYTDDILMAQTSLNNIVEFKRVYSNVEIKCGHEL